MAWKCHILTHTFFDFFGQKNFFFEILGQKKCSDFFGLPTPKIKLQNFKTSLGRVSVILRVLFKYIELFVIRPKLTKFEPYSDQEQVQDNLLHKKTAFDFKNVIFSSRLFLDQFFMRSSNLVSEVKNEL